MLNYIVQEIAVSGLIGFAIYAHIAFFNKKIIDLRKTVNSLKEERRIFIETRGLYSFTIEAPIFSLRIDPNFLTNLNISCTDVIFNNITINNIINPGDVASLMNEMKMISNGYNNKLDCQVRIASKAKEKVFVHFIGVPDPSDSRTRISGLVRVVENNFKTEKERHYDFPQIRYDHSVKVTEGVFNWKRSNGLMYISRALMAICGFDDSHEVENYIFWKSRLNKKDVIDIKKLFRNSVESKETFIRKEIRLRRFDDNWLWFLIRMNFSYDSNGDLEKVTGVATDITESRLNQMLLYERTEQLEVLFDLSPDALMIFDKSESVKFINPTFEKIFNIKIEHILGYDKSDFINIVKLIFKEDSGLRLFEQVLLNEFVDNDSRVIIRTNDVNSRVLLANVKSFDSSAISVIVYFRDITHESVVEEMKSNFLATAAHELRTPMTSIMGFSELLNSDRKISDSLRTDMLDSIYQQSIRMASILNELLDLARIEARGALDFNIKDVDLADVVLTVVNDFSTPDGRTPPEIDIFHVNCFIDFAKSIQALSNIVSNAYKYSLHGPVRVSMRTSDEMKEFILIDVIDNGIGIGEEDKQRLFERFFRADTSCSIPGTGLGLSIVREIMSNMGGGIYFDSVVNQGSTFTLSYPLSRVSYQETQNSVGSNTHHVIQIG